MKLTFLTPIWQAAKKLFAKSDKVLQEYIKIAVYAVEGLKTATDSPLADLAVAIIPGDTDNKILAKARLALPGILTALRLTAATYQALTGDVKNAMSGAIATNLAREISDFSASYDDTKLLVANFYKTEVKR